MVIDIHQIRPVAHLPLVLGVVRKLNGAKFTAAYPTPLNVGEIIVCGVRWSLRYALSYRDVEELLRERGVTVDHTTVLRWVQRYAPELDKRCRRHLTTTNDSYRVDETYIKIKKQWYYLYRAVDSEGQTIDFRLRATWHATAAERFFRKAL
jgi:IS6 family transposase